jgi:hypothetical protein
MLDPNKVMAAYHVKEALVELDIAEQKINSLQQLKDAISALAVEMEQAVYPNFSPFKTRKVITKMLLLSGRDKYNTATAIVKHRHN